MAQPIGIKIPIQQSNYGYFDPTFTTIDEAKSNMINLLLTAKGERLMQPELGTNIQRILFENVTAEINSLIVDDITEAVNQWLPYVVLQSVEVDTERLDNDNRIDVQVTFGIKQDPSINETINLTYVF